MSFSDDVYRVSAFMSLRLILCDLYCISLSYHTISSRNKVSLFLSFLFKIFAALSGSFQHFPHESLNLLLVYKNQFRFPTTPIFVHERGRARMLSLSPPSVDSLLSTVKQLCNLSSYLLCLSSSTTNFFFLCSTVESFLPRGAIF